MAQKIKPLPNDQKVVIYRIKVCQSQYTVSI